MRRNAIANRQRKVLTRKNANSFTTNLEETLDGAYKEYHVKSRKRIYDMKKFYKLFEKQANKVLDQQKQVINNRKIIRYPYKMKYEAKVVFKNNNGENVEKIYNA
jgi:hypothetical protein